MCKIFEKNIISSPSPSYNAGWMKKKKELNLVFLDLAKAFDTVLHESIQKGLDRKGVPIEVQELVAELYQDGTTVIQLPEENTRAIEINSGVKQGCPLSPLLFNIIMDELIERVESNRCGVRVNNLELSIMSFADDTLLISDSYSGMKIILDECERFFEEKGLKINAKNP